MTDGLDTDVTAQDTDVDGDPTGKPTGDDDVKFSKAQLNQIGSYLGRIVDNQLQEKVVPHLNEMNSRFETLGNRTQGRTDVADEYDDVINAEFFDNPRQAIDKHLEAKQRAGAVAGQRKAQAFEKAMINYSRDPLYKDAFPNARQFGYELLKQGTPPTFAAELAFNKAKLVLLESNHANMDTDNLEMVGSGKQSLRKGKKKTLTGVFLEEANKAIKDGLFKNHEEYVDFLDPKVRENLGV